ncbi:MAG: hypothetical protein GF368_04310 [Candidatus Aenigmarchaeota archaeon]|nr:hypothetical protein [Candidatus Aenigmarchaeota archaeon]
MSTLEANGKRIVWGIYGFPPRPHMVLKVGESPDSYGTVSLFYGDEEVPIDCFHCRDTGNETHQVDHVGTDTFSIRTRFWLPRVAVRAGRYSAQYEL